MGRTPKHRLVKVTFREPVEGRTEYFFGSFKAIFDQFAPEQVGTTLYYIYHYARFISADQPLETDTATISYVHFARASRR